MSYAEKVGLETMMVLKNTGHWISEERPKETIEALVNFLCELAQHHRRHEHKDENSPGQ